MEKRKDFCGYEGRAGTEGSVQAGERSQAVQVWGVLGVVAYLSYGVFKVVPIVLDGLGSIEETWQWGLLVVTLLFFAYVEGYRGFQLGFSPRVVSRAWVVSEETEAAPSWHKVLAPAFCIGYFHGTTKRVITSWAVTSVIFAVVIGVKQLDNPYRAIIDAGVIVGLSGSGALCSVWGILSIIFLYLASLQKQSPPEYDPARPLFVPAKVPQAGPIGIVGMAEAANLSLVVSSCSAYPKCVELGLTTGTCCPSPGPNGTMLDCCVDGPTACSAYSGCVNAGHTTGTCCAEGSKLECCEDRPTSCSAYAGCVELGLTSGACCTEGSELDCCFSEVSATPAPAPQDAACKIFPLCAALNLTTGSCCPTPDGVVLECCNGGRIINGDQAAESGKAEGETEPSEPSDASDGVEPLEGPVDP
ncbi:unnamed protein product [Effrenium voratum]|nr:unnamed protein product [Effrenium voratum]